MRNDHKNSIKTWACLNNLNVFIDSKKILSNINIKLNIGENILILGPNGSGKSTFLKLLNRSVYPIETKNSSMKLFGKKNINIWHLREKVGFLLKEMEQRVSKGIGLKDVISSGFSGTFNSKNSKLLSIKEKNKIEKLLNEFDLTNIINHEFQSLSDGQKRRALIARALVYEPHVLVLDEPFCNLDIKSNYILTKNLNALIDKSVSIIYVTHSLESILPKTNRVILLKEGEIINDGSPNEILKSKILSDLFEIPIDVIKQNNLWREKTVID